MKQIVVLQRGWVVVGQVTRTENEVGITDASVIRRWGTKAGLGELASNGPTPSTVLDPSPTIRVHPLAVVLSIDCVEEKWTHG